MVTSCTTEMGRVPDAEEMKTVKMAKCTEDAAL